VKIWWLSVPEAHDWGMRFALCSLGWFLLLYIIMCYVDMMRHRVPSGMERYVHNNAGNFSPFKDTVDLKFWSQSLHSFVLIFFVLLAGGWLGYGTVRAMTASSNPTTKVPTTAPTTQSAPSTSQTQGSP